MIEFTVFYVIFVFCFVFPPSAFVSAGITVSNIFHSWLGSEDLQFVQYHLRRTLATIVIHSLLPLGYFAGILLVDGLQKVLLLLESPLATSVFYLSALTPLILSVRVFFWSTNNWCSHPLVLSLAEYADSGRSWIEVASEINTEFRR